MKFLVTTAPKSEAQISHTACDWRLYPFHITFWKVIEVTLTANYEWLKETDVHRPKPKDMT